MLILAIFGWLVILGVIVISILFFGGIYKAVQIKRQKRKETK